MRVMVVVAAPVPGRGGMELCLCPPRGGRQTCSVGRPNVPTDGVDRIPPLFLRGVGDGAGRVGTVHRGTSWITGTS